MAFSDFKNVEQVLARYPLQFEQRQFLPVVSLELPAPLRANLEFILQERGADESEQFFRESLIFPLLQEAWKRHPRLKLWVNRALHYDAQLFGEPDYFVAASTRGEIIDRLVRKPLLTVAEAKRQDFELGWGQCLAEMIACQRLNDDARLTVYGIVTTGSVWEFGQLAGQVFTQNPLPYTLTDAPAILGILDFIFAACERQLEL